MAIARLRPGTGIDQVEAHASEIFDAVKGENWGDGKTKTRIVFGDLLPARAPAGTRTVRVLQSIAVVSLLVLLIACGNVGNLLLVRGLRRAPELALKTALGATRLRLLRETAIEAAVLAFASGIGALLVVKTIGILVRSYFLPPVAATVVPLDWRLMAITAAACAVAALSLGLAPALRLTRTRMATPGRVAMHGRSSPLLDVFVGAQIALAVPLLIGAGLFATSVWLARQDDFGFQVPRVTIVTSDLNEDGRKGEAHAAHLRIRDRLATLPGVEVASLLGSVPLREGYCTGYEIPGGPPPVGECAFVNVVDERFFDAMRFRATSGRLFTAADNTSGAPPVVVINEAMKRRFWPDRSPIGTCMRTSGLECVQVVGVVENGGGGPYPTKAEQALSLYFLPIERFPTEIAARTIALRTSVDPAQLVPSVQKASYDTVANLPYVDAWPLSDILEPQLRPLRLGSTVFLCLTGLALVISAAGLIVVTAHGVTRRTREMGIHLSLGATPGIVVRLMLRRTLVALAIGLAAGLGLAFAGSRLFSDLLYRVEPRDPRIFAACAAALLAAGTLAAWLPARRAGRIDPSVALRTE